VNNQQAKEILALYRPGTADAEDPFFAEALQRCDREPELKRWFDEHCTVYTAIRARFKQIAVPEGLKQQILSECTARAKIIWWQRPELLAVAAAIALLMGLAVFWLRTPRPGEDTFGHYSTRMTGIARRGDYLMDFETNDLTQIRSYLAQHHAPADYVLPAGLRKVAATGCAVEGWQNTKASMICFRTGKPLPPGEANDLWLFVIDRSAVKDAPASSAPQFAKVNRFITATWAQGDRLYLLLTEGDQRTIQQYL